MVMQFVAMVLWWSMVLHLVAKAVVLFWCFLAVSAWLQLLLWCCGGY